ncbi:hypothetical protein [Brevundimonas sp.]|uniref:hypothetical protein n=1 Tax=Brevundimonas sp. TaxID=1871086 RepID=UPI0028AE3326|nr:hypothetical protein [Brevundimonas sp.]
MARYKSTDPIVELAALGRKGPDLLVEDCRKLIWLAQTVFERLMEDAGHDVRQITRLTTKLRDAGRRSPPWKPVSSRVPGRPQDGADGNRTLRWKLGSDHKFYAHETDATLVEVKYYLQALSMEGAPAFDAGDVQDAFQWLLGHRLVPGVYQDPIQLIPINIHDVVENARLIQSGHLVPLDRGGRHVPNNAFLMLARSNQLQGNLTVKELLDLMRSIVTKHDDPTVFPAIDDALR